jgi:DNA-binding beta-propeller fold protein YncE
VSRFLIFLFLVFLGGCATEKQILRLDLEGQATAKRIYFPPISDDEVPRYVFVGELVGEQNFVDAEPNKKNILIEALKWVAGLFELQNPNVLQRPQSGVVDEAGRILVTDVSRGAVYVFDQINGRLDIWEFAEGYRRFAAPTGIAIGPVGRIFVADADLKQVFVLDLQGKGVGSIGEGVLERPTGLAWDPAEGLLYVADTQDHQIKVFDLTGRLVKRIGRRGEGPGEFNYPIYLALSEGKLFVTDSMNARVQVISLDDSEPPLIIGERGVKLGNFVRPKGVAVDSESNIYVVESYYDHLLIFDKQARFLLPIGGAGKEAGTFYLPSGVWVDRRNRVFVADTFNGRIAVFQFLGGGAENDNK